MTRLAAVLLSVPLAVGASAQCPKVWLGAYGCPGVAGHVAASTLWDPDGSGPLPLQLVLGGDFRVAGDIACENLVRWDRSSGVWTALPAAPLPIVTGLAALPSGDLLAVCTTDSWGSAPCRVATWNGAAWTVLGGDFDQRIHDVLVRSNGELLAGGEFTAVGSVPTAALVRWSGSAWLPFAGGITGAVRDLLELPNGDLVVGGTFASAGTVLAGNVARWNGTQWSPIGAGLQAPVHALGALPSGQWFAGADDGLWSWNGTTWSQVPGLSAQPYPVPSVRELLALPNGSLAVGGLFNQAGGQPASQIARYDPATSTWSTYGAGITLGYALSGEVETLTLLPSGELVVGGHFSRAGTLDLIGVAFHDGATWHALADGLAGGVECGVALDGDAFVVAGRFETLGNLPARWIAEWDGSAWRALGSGIGGASVFDTVADLVRLPNGDLIAGGGFDTAGGLPASGLARWDGVAWSQFAGGVTAGSTRGSVRKMMRLHNGDLVVGGTFTSAGGVPATNIAVWNGTSWSPLGAGVANGVVDLAVMPNGNLLVLAANEVVEWDGATWTTQVTYGNLDSAAALAVLDNGGFVVGGYESLWYGSNYRAFVDSWPWGLRVQSGLRSRVMRLFRLPDGDLLVAGSGLNEYGGVPVPGWVRLVDPPFGGLDVSTPGGAFFDFDTFADGDLLAVGYPYLAAGSPDYCVARLHSTCPATAVAAGNGCVGSGGPNVLTATSLPWIGSEFRAVATGMPANGVALGVFGFGTAAVPLSAILPQGQVGCSLLTTTDLLRLHLPNGSSLATSLAIPNLSLLIGLPLHHQVVPVEIGAHSGITAVTSTNRLTLTVGAF